MNFADKLKKILESGMDEDLKPQDNQIIDGPAEPDGSDGGKDKPLNFTCLAGLIHSGVKEIVLDSDIAFDEEEDLEYEYGIDLDVNGLVIDGNGHSIDGCGKAKMFQCEADNVTIRNITFKGGFARIGGAITNASKGGLSISDSTFANNAAMENGGAIYNYGKLKISKSKFAANNSKGDYDGGGAIFNDRNGNIDIEDSAFEDNKAVCEGGAIHNRPYADMSIRNSIFKANRSDGYSGGGAIYNKGEMTIEACKLNENAAKDGGAIHNKYTLNIMESAFRANSAKRGGAIFNRNNLTISECLLTANSAEESGGAICYIDDGPYQVRMSICDSSICANAAKHGAAIHNIKGSFHILRCEFSSNESKNHIVLNDDFLDIEDCIFKENHANSNLISNSASLEIRNVEFNANQSKHLIFNEGKKSNLNIRHAEFIENEIKGFLINHKGKFCSVKDSVFENNHSKTFLNRADLTLMNSRMDGEGLAIVNDGHLLVDGCGDLKDRIDGEGSIEFHEEPADKEPKHDFEYLDRMIHRGGAKEIVLEDDICLAMHEDDRYRPGIELDIDGLTIDGDGRTIDAAGLSRIFLITASDLTLKNITFKGGYCRNDNIDPIYNGGAAMKIMEGASVKIKNCRFIENVSEGNGGAIRNFAKLMISKSVFTDNGGRAISNKGELRVLRSTFEANHGGAIANYAKLTITNSTFSNNDTQSNEVGGAIYNDEKGRLTVEKSVFNENSVANSSGGAIYNGGEGNISVSDSNFTKNRLYGFECGGGGAIYVNSFDDYLKIRNCNFIDNRPNSVANFHNTYIYSTEYDVISYGPRDLDNPLKDFKKLNETTDSVFDLGPHEVLIVLEDGENLTSWDDVGDKSEILYISEDLSGVDYLGRRYQDLKNAKLIIAQNVTSKVTSAYKMFLGCSSLVDVMGFETWDTSNLESLENMFGVCSCLASCDDLKNLDVSNVRDMTAMFSDCRWLSNLDALKEWDVSNVTSMWSMFADCKYLRDVSALKDWDVSNVTNISSMFSGCALENLGGLELWDVSNVENMESLFWGCESLEDISALGGWNTPKLSNLSRAFWNCGYVSDISALKDWDVSNVTDMVYMFVDCKSISDLTPLGGWNVSKVKIMRSMFDGCSSIRTLDGLQNWNPSSVTTVESMFDRCKSLVDVLALESWNIPNGVTSGGIFKDCPNIKYNPLKKEAGNRNGPLKYVDLNFKFLDIYGAGWCLVRLADIYSRASYITDVPCDCLESIINAIENSEDFHVDFNGEGWEFEVRADSKQCYFNFKNGEEHSFDNMNKYDLAIVIYNNINENLSSWQGWSHENLEPLVEHLKLLIDGFDG